MFELNIPMPQEQANDPYHDNGIVETRVCVVKFTLRFISDDE